MGTSETLEKIKTLARDGRMLVSAHGYDELAADGIFFSDIAGGLSAAELVEDYPSLPRGRVFWFYNEIKTIGRSTRYGEFPKGRRGRRSW
jgi:hypothetical protein